MLIGYVRVSTNDQNTDLQRNALSCAGCERIFEDKISGTKSDRPGLKKLLRTLSAGDTLVVWKLDRLGRSMRHLVTLIEELRQRGVNFRSLTDSIDTSTPMGRFFFHVMGALAEMERELIVERTRANGAAFSAEEYPELAKVYPTNKLPDLRGEFIRGWDDGRGVDAGRQLLSSQGDAIRNIEGFADGGIGMSFDAIRGAFYDAGTRSARMPNNTTDIGKTDDLGFDASRVVPTANENRPRNIAFNYIVRAA
ncbi:site-specific recombinase [Salmonella enterica subsp. enterica serovar Typhi]|nr:site-specific recombinase [Salmonella enterica subsp. enterica serovar Typhi]